MAAEVARGTVVLTADTRRLRRDLNDAEKQTGRTGRAMGTALKAGGIAAAAGLAAVAYGLKKSVDAAKEAEISQRRVEAQLRALGISYEKHAGQIDTVIQKQSRLAALDDEELQESFTALVRVTGNVTDALRLNGVAADIARGKGIDLSAATAIVTKAQLGMVGSLRRQGIEIKPVTAAVDALKESKQKYTVEEMRAAKEADKTATSQKAIAALQRTFGGQAEAYGKSAAGASERVAVAWENLQERLGKGLLPLVAAGAERLADLFGWFEKIAGAPSLSVAVNVVAEGLGDLRRKVSDALFGAGDEKGIVDRISTALQRADWARVGQAIGAAVGGAIEIGQDVMSKVLTTMFVWLNAHAAELAEFGAEMAVRVVATLTDPVFWATHWELLLLALTIPLGGSFMRMGVRLAGRFVGGFVSRVGTDLLVAVEGVSTRLADTMLRAITSGWSRTAKLLTVGGVITAIRGVVESIRAVWERFFDWLHVRALRAALAVLEPFSHMPGKMGAWARDAKDRINAQLDKIRDRRQVRVIAEVEARFAGVTAAETHRANTTSGRARNGDGRIGAGRVPGRGEGALAAIGPAIDRRARSMTISHLDQNPQLLWQFFPPATNPGGLSPWILDELGIGQSMGLRLSSGLRPGAIVAGTNRPSLHAVGQAIDMVGSHGQMSMFARAVYGRSGVAEVLYDPLGGPFSSPRRDHYDHVHVGVRSGDGRVGVGDGLADVRGRTSYSLPGDVAGATRSRGQAQRLRKQIEAQAANATAAAQRNVEVSDRESGLVVRRLEGQASRATDDREAARLRGEAARERATADRKASRLWAGLAAKLKQLAGRARAAGFGDLARRLDAEAADADFNARDRGFAAEEAEADARAAGVEPAAAEPDASPTADTGGGGGGAGGEVWDQPVEDMIREEAARQITAQREYLMSVRHGFMSQFGSNVFSQGADGLQLGSGRLGSVRPPVTIVQNITKPDPDPFEVATRARFAAEAAF